MELASSVLQLTVGASTSFHLQAHSCLGAEFVQMKLGSLSVNSVPPEVGPGVYLSNPETLSALPQVSPGCQLNPQVTSFLIFCLLLRPTCSPAHRWSEALPQVTCLCLHLTRICLFLLPGMKDLPGTSLPLQNGFCPPMRRLPTTVLVFL